MTLLPFTEAELFRAVDEPDFKPRAAPAVHRANRPLRPRASKNARRARAATMRAYQRELVRFRHLVAVMRNTRDWMRHTLRQPSFAEQIFPVVRVA